jgi:hypothetical protein
VFFDYPKQAKFGRKIPKSTIYENASVNAKLKEKFVNQIDKIIWQYKLAPNTLNLQATENVPEIQVFDVHLKTKEIDHALFEVIDKAINFPIIFQIYQESSVKVKAAYKRPSNADQNKWVTETYFESEWLDQATQKQPLPIALDLGKLYEQLLKSLIPAEVKNHENSSTLDQQVSRVNEINALQKEIDQLTTKCNREKQFNRRVAINNQHKVKQKALDHLKKQ